MTVVTLRERTGEPAQGRTRVGGYGQNVFLWLANWWDGVELWLTGTSFAVQFALVIVVLGPVCLGVAWAIDRVVDLVSNRLPLAHRNEPAVDPQVVDPAGDGHPADTLSR
ncbi:MAG TPA: hypothetical protein VHW44_20670 [Pseudonocardiaceae bacterium]|nr:hypothetical protein [Pseudonocardiaceae bacterium]